jgi:WD40 repeat protein
VLDQLRWPPDPWVVGEFPTRRSGSSLPGSAAALGHVATASLAAHPSRPLFVSGSSSGRIYLWAFGEAHAKAGYVPMASTSSGAQGGGGSAPGAAASSPTSKRLPSHEAVSTPHWGNPAAVRFSRSGARFGAVGEGGLLGLWRQDFISAVDGMGHAEWVGHCLARAGTGIAFLGDTGSQVLVSGVGERGGCVLLVDTLAPPASATAATLLSPRGITPTTLCLVPSAGSSGAGTGAVLVVGDDAGSVLGYDVRVLDATRPLWGVRQQQQQLGLATSSGAAAAAASSTAGVTSLACWDPAWLGSGAGGTAAGLSDVVASGGRDSSVVLWDARSGALLQSLQCAHFSERKGLLERVGLGGGSGRVSSGGLDDPAGSVVLRPRPPGAVPAAVTDLHACAEGLLTCGGDGVVRFHPLTPLLDAWAAGL